MNRKNTQTAIQSKIQPGQNRILNLKYKALHGAYWMLYCLATAYITVFLLSYGYAASTIGVIAAVSNVLAAAGQLAVGSIADRSRRLTWKKLFLIIGGMEFTILLLLLFLHQNALVNGLGFPFFGVLMYLQMPLVNSTAFYYTNRGFNINFGSARGMGSIFYAVISFIAGQTIAQAGEKSLIWLCMIVLAILLTVITVLPCSKDCGSAEKVIDESTKATGGNLIAFGRKYPDFMFLLIGCILIMSFHNIGHTYMIQIMERVGGDSASMGTAFSIEALMELPIMFGFYKLIQRFRAGNLLIVSGIAFIAKSLAYLLAGSVMTLYAAQILQMFSYAVFTLASVYYAEQKMEKQDKVTGQSYMTASISIGAVLGNLTGGQVLENLGLQSLLIFSVMLTICGTLVIAGSVLYAERKIQKKRKVVKDV